MDLNHQPQKLIWSVRIKKNMIGANNDWRRWKLLVSRLVLPMVDPWGNARMTATYQKNVVLIVNVQGLSVMVKKIAIQWPVTRRRVAQ